MSNMVLREFGWKVIRYTGLGPLMLRIHPKSALLKLGYFRSFRMKKPVDSAGNPIPWWTYGAIAFLQTRIKPTFRVLEFGCGYSTIWLASRVRRILSFETDGSWARFVASQTGENVTISTVSECKEMSVQLQDRPETFDIAIIDGDLERMGCAKIALEHLSADGIVLWDNTDWPEWPRFVELMGKRGFREISFTGLAAQEIHLSRTTIFYRDKNCVGI